MNTIQNLLIFVFMFGFIISSLEGNLLLNICFQLKCPSDDTYLKLSPPNFDSNLYKYTIHIPNNYPFYTPTGPMQVNFYVMMNVSTTDNFNSAKSILFDASGEQALATTDSAYSSNEMLLISVQLWQPKDQVAIFDTENEITTKLFVYHFDENVI